MELFLVLLLEPNLSLMRDLPRESAAAVLLFFPISCKKETNLFQKRLCMESDTIELFTAIMFTNKFHNSFNCLYKTTMKT